MRAPCHDDAMRKMSSATESQSRRRRHRRGWLTGSRPLVGCTRARSASLQRTGPLPAVTQRVAAPDGRSWNSCGRLSPSAHSTVPHGPGRRVSCAVRIWAQTPVAAPTGGRLHVRSRRRARAVPAYRASRRDRTERRVAARLGVGTGRHRRGCPGRGRDAGRRARCRLARGGAGRHRAVRGDPSLSKWHTGVAEYEQNQVRRPAHCSSRSVPGCRATCRRSQSPH